MQFTTPIEFDSKSYPKISYEHTLVSLGSCFSENMGGKLQDLKFKCLVNPFGVLYNPESINQAILEILEQKQYSESDLFFNHEQWHSWMHHGSFSNRDICIVLETINSNIETASNYFEELDFLLLTFGSSWIYRLNESNRIISNCHRVSSNSFVRERLTVEEIVNTYSDLISLLLVKRPNLKIVFSISPIRHIRDGLHENQKSKAILLLAIEELQAKYPHTICYFPSYEILIDELRDYRFYADDMVHPSKLAVEYIWERIEQQFFDKPTQDTLKECLRIQKSLTHRPLNPGLKSHQMFLEQLISKMENISIKNAKLDFRKEIDICLTQLKKYQNY